MNKQKKHLIIKNKIPAYTGKQIMSSYLETTHDVYKEAALTPDVGLCCTTNPIWELPGLKIPKIMQEMNYGCGSTVHARDLTNNPKMLYVGVGGGMELLQFAYFNRQKRWCYWY